ncbi:MAG: hypothetical protein JST60_17880 [Chloroflexi bacterium SZAS-1]|jgi:hypothetical protein|nr:hypothetical protein [Chloroflexi bacterium SZAS-1]HNP88854.1 hypothetical protein [Kouleothrix sp.]
MKFTRKEYTNRNEKVLDFVIGFLGWYLLNALLYGGTITLLSMFDSSNSQNVAALGLLALPLLLNIGALVGLGMWRRWIAFGALAAFGIALLMVLILGILIYAVCYNGNFS